MVLIYHLVNLLSSKIVTGWDCLATVQPMKKLLKEWKTKDPKQKAYMAAGIVSVVIAIVGVFLPIVPQVPFAILAAYLFAKGSRRLHKWVRKNKYFGEPVRDWEDHHVVRPKLKAFSTLAMIGGGAMGHFK